MLRLHRYLLLATIVMAQGLMGRAFAEDFSIEGKLIAAVNVEHDTNLRESDLIADLGIRVGEIITEERLSHAIAKLQERDIFRQITVHTDVQKTGVALTFKGESYQIVSLIEFLGEKVIDERALRRLAGVKLGSRLDTGALQDASQRIEFGYRDYGHFGATVEVKVDRRTVDPLVRVRFLIDEGTPTKLSDVAIAGILPPDVALLKQKFTEAAVGRIASAAELKNLSRELLFALRSEGYLEAYVRAGAIQFEPLTGDAGVEFNVETRDPLSIIFEGNTLFSTTELLSLLRMDSRTVPFSPNAIPTLTREVEQYYERRGYFFTAVGYEQLPSKGNRREFKITIRESGRYRIGSLSFVGSKVISSRELRELTQTQSAGFSVLKHWTPGFLSIEQLENDIEAIRRQYEARGYYEAAIEYKLSSESGDNSLDVAIVIREGAQSVVREVDVIWNGIASNKAGASGALLALFPALEEGAPFVEQRIEDVRLDFLRSVSSLGYPTARVDTEFDRANGAVRFVATPGERVHIGRILNQGNLFTRDSVIEHELMMQAGSPWDSTQFYRSEQGLYRLGFFRAVSIAPLDGAIDTPVEDVVVKVAERDSGSFEFGGDINSEDGLHLVAEVRQRNFQGNGNGLAIGADAYVKSADHVIDAGTIRGVYSDPRLGVSNVEMYNELFLQQSIELSEEFSYDRYGNSNLFRFPILDSLTGNVSASFFRERVYDVPTDIIIGDNDAGSRFYSILANELDFDLRDDKFNPSRGFRSLLRSRVASSVIGSEADFVGFLSQQTGYLPLTKRLVWVNNLALQALIPIGNSDEIPLSQRIFLGGRNSLRGFSPNKVGPRGAGGNIVGGDTSIVMNSQLEYSLTDSVLSTVFFDAGQTRLEYKGSFGGDPLSLDDLRYSPGIGLQYKTPIGPIGLEYGVALDREFGERFGRLNFSIGSAF